MSKKGNKRSGGQGSSGSTEGAGSASATAVRKERKPIGTVAERLATKADTAYKFAADALKLAKARRVPQGTISSMEDFMVDIGGWRDTLKALVDEGWEPAEAATMQDLTEGESIAIDPEHVSDYAYISGVADGTIKLVAGQIKPAGRSKAILLKIVGEDGAADQFFGWAPLSHLMRR
jgi:hypothetical protein